MSLINEYLKRLSHTSKTLSSKGKRRVPPVLQRSQEDSVHKPGKKSFVRGAVVVFIIYSVGYFMVTAVTAFQQPDDSSVTVRSAINTASQPSVSLSETQDVVVAKSSSVAQLPRQSDNLQKEGTIPASVEKAVQQGGEGSVEKFAKKKPLEQTEIKNDDQSNLENGDKAELNNNPETVSDERIQSQVLAKQQEPEIESSIVYEEPLPLTGISQQQTDTVTVVNEIQNPLKRVVFKESKNQPAYYYQLALQAQHNNQFVRAERYYKIVLQEEPTHENAMLNLAAIYILEKRFQEAQLLINDIIAVNPENSKALVNAGMILLQYHKDKEATDYFLKALRYNPIEETALVNLAYLAQKEKQYEKAIAYYEQLIRIAPEKTNIYLAYAGLEEKKSNYSAAIKLYLQCLDQLNMQKHPDQYDAIKIRIQVLRRYESKQAYKNYFEVGEKKPLSNL